VGIDILTKGWSFIPPVDARPVRGHSLCPKYGFLLGGRTIDIVTNIEALLAGTQGSTLYSPTSARGFAGQAREHSATTDFDTLGLDSLVLPLADISIVLGYQKTDATARGSVAFGTATGTTSVCDGYIPFSDGITYWDYGGTAGTNRLTVGGLTFGDDIWAFTQGARGAEIWQNGILRASNAGVNTRVQGGTQFQLGKNNSQASDLAKWKFFWIYHRQLQIPEIARITMHPFCWVAPRS